MSGGGKKSQIIGYKYYFGIHMGLGMPIDELVAIKADGKEVLRKSITVNGRHYINKPNLFGGDKKEGGIKGNLDVMLGDENQTVASALRNMLGGLVPAFRGLATVFYDGQISAMSPYPKPWTFLRRGGEKLFGSSPWYLAKMHIWLANGKIRAMNPAHILYLIYTSPNFRGISTVRMDDAAWRAAADRLHAEGLGLCLEWRKSDSYKNFVDTVIAHIGAEVYDDRRTGLISIRLMRDDYNPADLQLFDENSGLLEIDEDTRPSQDAMPSEVIVKYVDAIDGESRQVRAVNAAIAASAGGRSAEVVSYPGVPTGEIAGRLAQRDLRIKTSSLRRFKVTLDRRGRDLHPGQVFKIRSLRRGIDQVVVRAGRVDDQFLVDGKIVVTAIQDVFGLPAASYVAIPEQVWEPPNRDALPITVRRLVEAAWRDVVMQLDPANIDKLDGTEATLAVLARPPSHMTYNFNIAERIGSDYEVGMAADFCPNALIETLLPKTQSAVTVSLSDVYLFDLVTVGQAALVNDEIMRVSAVTVNNQVTLERGCVDTTPAPHSANSRIWFYDAGVGVSDSVFAAGTSVTTKLLSNTSANQLSLASAPSDSIAFVGRIGKPYPPARLRIDGRIYPDLVETDEVVVSWVGRNRLTQDDQLIPTTTANIVPEPNTTYTARLLKSGTSTQLAYESGITGTTVTFTGVGYVGYVDAEVWSVRDGIDSLQKHTHTFYLDPSDYLSTEVGERLITESDDYLLVEEAE